MRTVYVIEFKNTELAVYYYVGNRGRNGLMSSSFALAVKFSRKETAQEVLDNLKDKRNYHVVEHGVG